LDIQIGALLVSGLSGIASIPLFLVIARHYLQAQRALYATLLYFLLPPVFVFSGVNYSEPLFLLITLLAWHFHLTGREL
jgi:4-amino-4-deoxy-L-arabinose transferase-like glycosyltransferase